MTDRHLIELIDVSKEYAGDVALEHVNLYIKDGEFLTLLGPSGCGKTTMLRLIAGFIQPTSGRIEMDGVDIANVPPYKRKINTVFQKYALFPHLNVFDNIAFGLKIKKMDKALIREKVEAMLELVNLRGYGERWIDQLSGGQQQRASGLALEDGRVIRQREAVPAAEVCVGDPAADGKIIEGEHDQVQDRQIQKQQHQAEINVLERP